MCILGAAASSSSSAESADTDAGQASGLGLQPEAASSSTLQLSRQSGHETMAELAPCQPFNCFAHEHRAGQQGHAKTPRGFDAAGSSFAGQQQGNQASTQSAHGTTEQFADAGVHSPVSLADGVADAHEEADTDCAHLHPPSGAPDTCVLFRPAGLHSKAHEDSWLPGKHASEVKSEASSEQQQAAPASKDHKIVAKQECKESDSTAGAGCKRDTSARQAGASGTAPQLFSPVEAIRGFSRVNIEACEKPKEVAHPSSRAAQQAIIPAQASAAQRAQRYSKVHAVTDDQQYSQSQASNIQVEHVKPANTGTHHASGDADSGHILRASSVFLEASGAADQAQQARQASMRVGKENDLPALPVAPILSSTTKEIHEMGGHYVVQDNPLSALEPSPEVICYVQLCLPTALVLLQSLPVNSIDRGMPVGVFIGVCRERG